MDPTGENALAFIRPLDLFVTNLGKFWILTDWILTGPCKGFLVGGGGGGDHGGGDGGSGGGGGSKFQRGSRSTTEVPAVEGIPPTRPLMPRAGNPPRSPIMHSDKL